MNTTMIITVALIVAVTLFAIYGIYLYQAQANHPFAIRSQRIREVPVEESQPLIYEKAVEEQKEIEEEVKEVKLTAKPANTKPAVISTLNVETPAHA